MRRLPKRLSGLLTISLTIASCAGMPDLEKGKQPACAIDYGRNLAYCNDENGKRYKMELLHLDRWVCQDPVEYGQRIIECQWK